MKKPLLLTSLLFLTTGLGVTSPTLTLKAETPAVIAQVAQNSPPPANPAQSEIELIDPGIQPRQELRFIPAANTRQTTKITMKTKMAGSIDGQVMPAIDFPPVAMTMEAIVKEIDANGDTHIEVSYSQVEIAANSSFPANVIEAMRSQLEKVKGLKMSYTIDSQGKTKDLKVEFPDNIDPNIKQFLQPMLNSLEQLSASPMPSIPVGIGGKWRVTTPVPPVGLPIEQMDVFYELVSWENNVVTLKVSTDVQGDPNASHNFNFPGMPPGVEMNIKSMAIQSTGTLTGRLDRILPDIGNISVTSNMEFTIKDPKSNQESQINMKSSIDMTMESQ
ncbi:MAG TPA: hypothetical protein DEG17_02730 [Cyanobacteria bacterium UBA11149]|nr:hypothetical protein [Cyanobacteria bacterium UBA11149]